MEALVVAIWIVTALGGVALYATWLRASRRSGRRVDEGVGGNGGGITSELVAPHATLVATGLIFWIATAVAGEDQPLAAARVIAIALLVVGMFLGVVLFRNWRSARRAVAGPDDAVPAVAVVAHGVLAVATLAGAVIAAIAA